MKATVTLLVLITVCSAVVAPADSKPEKSNSKQKAATRAADKKKPVEDDNSKLTRFMRVKLQSSQDVLEGLVTEDFAQIEKGAKKMLVMSKAAEWQVFQTATYSQYSAEFQRTVEKLLKAAQTKQLDSAALRYMHVTITCVNCHKYVKKVRIAQGQPLSDGLKFALQQDMRRSGKQRN